MSNSPTTTPKAGIMEHIGLRLIGETEPATDPLVVETNDETGMVAEIYPRDGALLVATYHDAVGLVTWYRATDEIDVLEWLGVA